MPQQYRGEFGSRVVTGLVVLGLSASVASCGTVLPQAAPQQPAPPPAPATVTVTEPAEQETSEPRQQDSEDEKSTQENETGSAEDPCAGEDVEATLNPSRRGDLGTENRTVVTVTNTSSDPCTVDGFPAVKLTDESGGPLPTDRRRSMESYSPIVLTPGAGADSYLSWEVQTSPCSDANGLQVTLPGSEDVVELNWKLGAVCSNGLLDVGPFVEHR
ncbi:DUF4232 domain-containing protein [Allosaccharopolyspora coralli]|uniref:DUF4232 domain-containing protein n=1 Tax=Allosaccharopolyspora coralli TaxID=2665642 RepID=A0A5Q3Q890_9PSEU|nr:DUF4232 domain-containing protein [Allosaccharopolyspora coralli]QGK70778.1 DUF4232 domain-containing protein [Allosaccharopolyspora coralli]